MYQKVARLAYGLVNFHPFVDGNKRIAAHAMLLILKLNGVDLTYSQDELFDLFISLADESLGYEDLVNWIIGHIDD
ncbi:MAG: type II toxin-antitoxin system death-on-curing family toxin [Clostridia bacterium]|nr:type II toxin-antitoxin system death-on-curing family toxin [Clostridia bacterium]